MNLNNIVNKISDGNYPIGLSGCKNSTHSFDCCEYNVTVFDNKKENDHLLEIDEEIIIVHHASLDETNSNVLIQFENMKIISDEKWELRMFLSKIDAKKQKIFKNYIKNCLIDSTFCISKAKEGIKNSDPFSPLWVKCAAFFIADSISVINNQRPSPTHMLQYLRDLEKNRINENLSILNNCLGIERATPSLLSRMCKSTIGFSEMVNEKFTGQVIQKKYDFLVKNSLLSDCYFYLLYLNRDNVIKIKDDLHKKPELIHILKIAFDLDKDFAQTANHANLLHNVANNILSEI